MTHRRFYLIETHKLSTTMITEEQRVAVCEVLSYNSSAGMVLTVLSWPQVYFSCWHFSVMSLVCLLQIWVMTRLLGSNSLDRLLGLRWQMDRLTAHVILTLPHLEYWASGRFSEQLRELCKACGRFFQHWLRRGRHSGPEWIVYHLWEERKPATNRCSFMLSQQSRHPLLTSLGF